MKRDMDFAREILRDLSESDGDLPASAVAGGGHGAEETAYHFELLIEAGLAEGSVAKSWGGKYVQAYVGWQRFFRRGGR